MDTATTNLILGSLLGLLVSMLTTLVNSFLMTTRERLADKRKISQEHFALIEKTYEDVLYLIHTELDLVLSPESDYTPEHAKEYGQQIHRHRARLELLSIDPIVTQFQKASLSIKELQFKMLTIHNERPITLEDIRNVEPSLKVYAALSEAMRKHLELIRKQSR